jgi:hypothetical protein
MIRLLHCKTFQLREFRGDEVPPYVTLSQTWCPGEVLYEDLAVRDTKIPWPPTHKEGWPRIQNSCTLALKDGYEFIWIETCCVDKTNSAERTEEMNSCYKWFQRCAVSYTYLVDFNITHLGLDQMRLCRWFTRSFTLQELIAPPEVKFYSQNWELVGLRSELVPHLYSITGVDPFVLAGGDVKEVKIARKMFWASHRMSSMPEDQTYALLGLFGIQMPLSYGEGENAFQRLQHEIFRSTEDTSLLAWKDEWSSFETERRWLEYRDLSLRGKWNRLKGILAVSPTDFEHCGSRFPALAVDGSPLSAVPRLLLPGRIIREPVADDSEDSDLESMWDTTSVASTASSVASSRNPATKPEASGLKLAIHMLTDNPDIRALILSALQEKGIDIERLRRNLYRTIFHLARDLRREASTQDERDATAFVRHSANSISSGVLWQLAGNTAFAGIVAPGGRVPPPGVPLAMSRVAFPALGQLEGGVPESQHQSAEDSEEDNTEASNSDEDASDGEESKDDAVEFSNHIAFVRNSVAFRRMIRRLGDFVHPSFRSQALALTARLSMLEKNGDMKFAAKMNEKLRSIISELQYAQPDKINIQVDRASSRLNRFQAAVETLSGETWDWWPLSPAEHALKPSEVRISWRCVSHFILHRLLLLREADQT